MMGSRCMRQIIASCILCFFAINSFAQPNEKKDGEYWSFNSLLTPHRLPPPPLGYMPVYLDLDKDGDPDVIKSLTAGGIPIAWIDDDDDMRNDALEGDTDSGCLLIDRNQDGRYGALGDLIIDWVDTNKDNRADMQVVVDYPLTEKEAVWPNGHYMWMLDTDKDNVFNYIDWHTFQLKAWDKNGLSDFAKDYSGQSTFMKVHAATNRIQDLRLNWENPFLFYDEDKDGLTEMAVRLANTPSYINDSTKKTFQQKLTFSGKIDWVSISVDLDNDNGPGNEFDFDFSLGFRGEGFDYTQERHAFPTMKGLSLADSFFLDPRWRHLEDLIYPDHSKALPMVFTKGKWDKVYFVYDEDDDCNRWERVEFYDPLDPFKIGSFKGGIDNHPQSDVAGDRGEWDLDNSGKGKIYISKFDGRLHLYGAERGVWRIDQSAYYYQGWDRSWLGKQPQKFATVKYEDVDKNGFFDRLSYDLDGDTLFENIVDLKAVGLNDQCNLIDVSNFTYRQYKTLQATISNVMWQRAQAAIGVAKNYQLNLDWYAKLLNKTSTHLKYSNGYWLQFYIYQDLLHRFAQLNNQTLIQQLHKAYYSGDWSLLSKENKRIKRNGN